MTNRREFLHMGVAALSLPIAARAGVTPGLFAPESEPGVNALPLYKTFFDERFAACAAFADALKRRGLPTHAIRGDITDVWFNDLYYQWKKEPTAIAGLTAPGPIFCLEMLARDAGMRAALRVDHRQTASDQLEHEFAGPASVIARVRDSEVSDEHWPERMAEMVVRFPAELEAAQKAAFSGRAALGNNDPEHLVTWVIAPARRA